MQNELNWVLSENNTLPMVLEEKGLGLKGFQKLFFYFCTFISFLSMLWVIVISFGVFLATNKDPTLPDYYKFVAVGCIVLSGFCINTLIKFYRDKKNYYKYIKIADGKVKFKEVTMNKTIQWEERIKKYTSVELRHFNYRRISSWYILLQHQDKEKRFAIFSPEYKYQNADETSKHEVLDFYGKLFGLPTKYLDLEASYKASHPEEEKKKTNE